MFFFLCDYMLSIKKTYITLFVGCQIGTYGENCKEHCGLCLNNDDCYHVNGTCVKGCLPGYMGDKCKTRKLPFFALHLLISFITGTSH